MERLEYEWRIVQEVQFRRTLLNRGVTGNG